MINVTVQCPNIPDMLDKVKADLLKAGWGCAREEYSGRYAGYNATLYYDVPEYLPKEQLVPGNLYVGSGRNFNRAVWNGHRFVGRREKFGHTFEDEEHHYDEGPPYGTFKPFAEETKP